MGAINHIQLAAFLAHSRANGPGLRSVLWVQGCPFRCHGCFNKNFLDFNGGREVTVTEVINWILAESDTEGVSFSGGEPFSQATALAEVAESVHQAGKGVLVFTGFTYYALFNHPQPEIKRLLAASDLLVAGPYQQDNPSRHSLLASANQELIFLSDRYRNINFKQRRIEFHINLAGDVTITGFPYK